MQELRGGTFEVAMDFDAGGQSHFTHCPATVGEVQRVEPKRYPVAGAAGSAPKAWMKLLPIDQEKGSYSWTHN